MNNYKSKDENQITENINSMEFSKNKGGILQDFDFDSDMKLRTCTWILTNTKDKDDLGEASSLFDVCMTAINHANKFELKKEDWKELDSDNPFTMIDIEGEGCGIGLSISKTCKDKKCRKREHYLFYYQINVNPSNCAPELIEPDFMEFTDKLSHQVKKDKDMIRIRLKLKPMLIKFRYSTRELKDLVKLIKNFKPKHKNLEDSYGSAFVKYWHCADCHQDKNQIIEFGVCQIYDEGTDDEGLGVPNCVCSFSEDEMSELIYGFKQKLEQNNETINGGKVSERWK